MVEKSELFTAGFAAQWSGGNLFGDNSISITSVEVDSRKCRAGSLFFALVGERVDGHNYLEQALENGACGAVVSGDWMGQNEDSVSEICANGKFLLSVESPLASLQNTAAAYMRGISHPVRIGITGSNGKTTTKELVAAVLSEKYSVIKTAGNYNSEIGLPLTVFNINDSHDYAVIEMGVNRIGEMDILSGILSPDIVVITNIGSAHIGIFKDINTIASEKRQAVSQFTGDGKLFVYEKEPFAAFLARGLKGTFLSYGEQSLMDSGNKLTYKSLGLNGWDIVLNEQVIHFPLIGEHNLNNAFCSIVLGRFAGVGDVMIKTALEKIKPLFGRSQIIDGPVTVIQDCYNSNADSLKQSISFADELEWCGEKIYVIGDMKELGDDSVEIHKTSGREAAASTADKIIFFGDDSIASYNEALTVAGENGSSAPEFYHTSDFDELQKKVLNLLKVGDLLLIKGSRTMNLERLLKPVEDNFKGTEC